MRNGVNQGNSAFNQSSGTAATLGADASGIGSTLTPFLTAEMLHPEGIGPEGIAAEQGAASGAAGGGMSAVTGAAMQRAGASRNAGGFQAALDDAARQRMKADAGASENIQAQNENMKEQQRQAGARGLGSLYGVDTSGMLKAESLEPEDVNAEANANNTGWFQNTMSLIRALTGGAGGGR